MKVVSTNGLTKLIQLIKSNFIDKTNTTTATVVSLADVATSGDYDDLINKPTIPTIPDIDNTTITKNTDDELQTVAVIDNNSGSAIKTWTGTKAQYNAIVTKDTNTQYTCTDSGEIYLGTTLISNDGANKSLSNLNATGQAIIDGKADVDLTNVTNAGYIKMAGASMPSNTYVDLTLGASGTTYTAPANGWFYLVKSMGANASLEMFNSTTTLGTRALTTTSDTRNMRLYIPVKSGDIIEVSYSNTGSTVYFRFIYAQGSESEA